ncbi:MAG: IS21 family transposase [Bacteroidales bacterium]|nr:IS21 family transposase [Bacteroidales bacterium]
MTNKSISMTQVRRIIQLKAEGLSKLKISGSLHIHRATLDNYLSKFETSGKSYPELMQYSDEQLIALVYNGPVTPKADRRIDDLKKHLDYFREELSRPGVTRKTLWEEYQGAYPEGYRYAQFCEHFTRYIKCTRATMHLFHRAGEYLQVDFAGKQLHYIDVQTGEIITCPVLVCTLPFSSYTYVEALSSARQEYLFCALNRCLEYFGGVPRNVLSDNMKQFVGKNQRYEYKFQELADQWAVHYNTNLEATRPRKPKDKPTVENNVYLSYLRIYAKIRNEEFHSVFELNIRIRELLGAYNQASFQKLPGSRQERFLQDERPLLRPLPQEPFTIKHTTAAKVQMNYHVILGEDKHLYSVPHQYIGQTTKIIYDEHNVEIYIGFQRIAIHKRDYRKYGYTTLAEHMPASHLKYNETLGWDADYFVSLASKIGESAVEVFKKILASKDFIEQTYNACIGLKRLSEIYGVTRFEAACRRALNGSRVTYGMIKNILENNMDKQSDNQINLFSIPDHENIRGSQNYN